MADVLSLTGVYFHHFHRRYHISDQVVDFSFDFEFGKSYLLESEICKGAWALAWLISGDYSDKDRPHGPFGDILLNDQPYPVEKRRADSWLVTRSEFEGFWARRRTLQGHIEHGVRTTPDAHFKTEEDYRKYFKLTPERYDRRMTQLSHEQWRASCAVGLAHGKRVFCFPYVEFLRPYLIAEYFDLWLKSTVDVLCDSGAMVLIPALGDDISRQLCNVVVPVRRPEYAIPPKLRTSRS